MLRKDNKKSGWMLWASLIGVLVVVVITVYFSGPGFSKYISLKNFSFSSVISGVLSSSTNSFREGNNVESLVVSDVLSKAAQMKALDMASRGYFSHVDPQGNNPWVWFDRVGYDYRYAGENLALDFTESEDVIEAWIDSAKHRANLLNPNFTEVGIGIAEGMYQGRPTTFVVQFFGRPVGNPDNVEYENEVVLVDGEALAVLNNPSLPVVTRDGLEKGAVLGASDSYFTSSLGSVDLVVIIFIIALAFWAGYSRVKRLFKKTS